MRPVWLASLALLAACTETQFIDGGGGSVSTPSNLLYTVEPSGTPGAPTGVLLQWDYDSDPDLSSWNVYSRGSTSDAYRLRATTTSNTFHDEGLPHLQYYVTAEDLDGYETGPSNVVTVDERLALDKPTTLVSTTLNGAVALTWSDNAYLSQPESASGSIGSTVPPTTSTPISAGPPGVSRAPPSPRSSSPAALPNGVPRCFGVSAVSIEGFESLWSPIVDDTPRPDARNVVVVCPQFRMPAAASASGATWMAMGSRTANGRA